MKGRALEEKQIHRKPDRCGPDGMRDWHAGRGTVPASVAAYRSGCFVRGVLPVHSRAAWRKARTAGEVFE